MKLILAQGNPGPDYAYTRHNVGFMIVDRYIEQVGGSFQTKAKFFADIAEVSIDGEKVVFVKPSTFYNETGRAYRALCDFYKIRGENTLIIHDELSLPLGTLRIRQGGSDAGNNGIKSINAHGGTQSFRLRVGIRTPLAQRAGDTDFVLGRFRVDEKQTLDELEAHAVETIESFVRGDIAATTRQVTM